MPKAQTAPKAAASASSGARKSKVKKPLTARLLELYTALERGLETLDLPADALKVVDRIIRLAPDDRLAQATRIHLLIAAERYHDALLALAGEGLPPASKSMLASASSESEIALPAGDPIGRPVETGYCLYKLERFDDARRVVDGAKAAALNDESLDRGLLLLEAQLLYRLEDHAASREAYEGLLTSVDFDTPEQADIEANIEACTAHLDFSASIPTRLADAAVDVPLLESTPLVTVLPQVRRTVTKVDATAESPELSKRTTRRKARRVKLPPAIAAMSESERPAPDPYRWVKKSERPDWPEQRARSERDKGQARDRKQKRAREAAATQGGHGGAAPKSTGGGKKKSGR